MKTFVINLDTEPGRWATMRQHLAQWPDLDVHRWPATTPHGITPNQWHSRASGPARRIAIIRSYRTLLQSLKGDGPWLILQDDIRLDRTPIRSRFPKPVHLYGGYRTVPTVAKHVCPQAVTLTRPAVAPLLRLWSVETRQSCELWTPYLTNQTVTYDRRPTSRQADTDTPSTPR